MAVALLLRENHVSVGASTCCFGAIGLLAGMSKRSDGCGTALAIIVVWRRAWLPLLTGIALLALIGTGPRSDLAAHAFGFGFGALLALPLCRLRTRQLPGWVDNALQLACVSLVMGAWAGGTEISMIYRCR